MPHSRNPIKLSIADAIKMYLKKPLTSLQLTSLKAKNKRENIKIETAPQRLLKYIYMCVSKYNIEWSDHMSRIIIFIFTAKKYKKPNYAIDVAHCIFKIFYMHIIRTDSIGHHVVFHRLESHWTLFHFVAHHQNGMCTPMLLPWYSRVDNQPLAT